MPKREKLPEVLARQIAMLRLIPRRPHKITARALHERLESDGFEVDLRSVQRDLQKLRVPLHLHNDEAKPAGWSWPRNARPPVLPVLDPASALTLSMVEQYLAPLLPRGLLEVWQSQFDEARRTLDGGKFGKWRQRVAMLPSGPAWLPVNIADDVVDVVYNALLDNVQFDADYRPLAGKSTRYTFNPLGLVHRDGVTYLVATREDMEHISLFALHRMKRPARSEHPSREPEGFSLKHYIEQDRQLDWPVGRQIKLELRLGPGIKHYFAERTLSNDQKMTPIEGTDEARLTASVQDTLSLHWWLRSFGSAVEVLAPKSLREEMAGELKAAASQYRKRR